MARLMFVLGNVAHGWSLVIAAPVRKYIYSGDKKYLESVYPVLKGATQFYLDFLTEEPEHQWLVVCHPITQNSPSVHPESPFQRVHHGQPVGIRLVYPYH
jgi:hypothetical protein